MLIEFDKKFKQTEQKFKSEGSLDEVPVYTSDLQEVQKNIPEPLQSPRSALQNLLKTKPKFKVLMTEEEMTALVERARQQQMQQKSATPAVK